MKYEDLVRILEEEKKSTISRIAPDFYSQVNRYIKELEDADRNISRRHSQEAIMIQYELKNALSTIEKIFNKRTRKIIKMASIKAFSKNPAHIGHDIDNMTPEEREIYHQMLNTILQGKKNTIEPILGISADNEPDIPSREVQDVLDEVEIAPSRLEEPVDEERESIAVMASAGTEDRAQEHVSDADIPQYPESVPGVEVTAEGIPARPEETASSDEDGKKDLNKEYIVVRILKDISTFAGSDGRNYTLNAQDVAVLPKVNAKALLKRKMAVEVKSS